MRGFNPKYKVPTKSFINKEIDDIDSLLHQLKDLSSFTPSYDLPVIETYDSITVWNDNHIPGGSRTRFLEYMFASMHETAVAFIQPRFNPYGLAISELCKKYNKEFLMFTNKSSDSAPFTEYQKYCLDAGADLHLLSSTSMNSEQYRIRKFARDNNIFYIEHDLNHIEYKAAIVNMLFKMDAPNKITVALNYGLLCRIIQVAYPETRVYGLAVSKNLSDGDIGEASVVSSYMYYDQKTKRVPPFKSDLRFDGKVWEYLEPGDLFWNTI